MVSTQVPEDPAHLHTPPCSYITQPRTILYKYAYHLLIQHFQNLQRAVNLHNSLHHTSTRAGYRTQQGHIVTSGDYNE